MHDTMFAKEVIIAINARLKKIGKGERVTSVSASLSPLSHVKPETLQETFQALVKDTSLDGISLNVRPLKLAIKCDSCGNSFEVDKPTFACPKCHGSGLNIVHSKEFAVDLIHTEKTA